jgi:hypothetical protein
MEASLQQQLSFCRFLLSYFEKEWENNDRQPLVEKKLKGRTQKE